MPSWILWKFLLVSTLVYASVASDTITPESVKDRFLELEKQCDDLIPPVRSAMEPSQEALAALKACFVQRAYEYAYVVRNATEVIAIKHLSTVKETECKARLPVALAVLRYGFPYYASIHEDYEEKVYKRAMDRFCIEFSYYLNDYTCLNYLNLTQLQELLNRGLEIFYRESDRDTQNEATRKKMMPEFPFLDLKMSVDTKLLQKANEEYERDTVSEDEEVRQRAEAKFREALEKKVYRLTPEEESKQALYLDLRTKLPYNPGTADGVYVLDEYGYIIPQDELEGTDPISQVLQMLGIDPRQQQEYADLPVQSESGSDTNNDKVEYLSLKREL